MRLHFVMESIHVAKKVLRREIAARLKLLDANEIKRQSTIVSEKIFAYDEFKRSKRISIYLSMDAGELQTNDILERIFSTGRDCFIPRYSKLGMDMVRLNSMDDYSSLPKTKWMIRQPLLEERREDPLSTGGLDLIICPGVAFTKGGHRLGHGGGYYDAYINSLSSKNGKRPHIIALALKEQLVDFIPVTPTDVIVDKVFFED